MKKIQGFTAITLLTIAVGCVLGIGGHLFRILLYGQYESVQAPGIIFFIVFTGLFLLGLSICKTHSNPDAYEGGAAMLALGAFGSSAIIIGWTVMIHNTLVLPDNGTFQLGTGWYYFFLVLSVPSALIRAKNWRFNMAAAVAMALPIGGILAWYLARDGFWTTAQVLAIKVLLAALFGAAGAFFPKNAQAIGQYLLPWLGLCVFGIYPAYRAGLITEVKDLIEPTMIAFTCCMSFYDMNRIAHSPATRPEDEDSVDIMAATVTLINVFALPARVVRAVAGVDNTPLKHEREPL